MTAVNGHELGPPLVPEPSHDERAERIVLGHAINNPTDTLPLLHALPPDAFYTPRHATYRDALTALDARGVAIEQYSLLDTVLGLNVTHPAPHTAGTYISDLITSAYGTDLNHWIDRLLEHAQQRRMLAFSQRFTQTLHLPDPRDREARFAQLLGDYQATAAPHEADTDRFPQVDWADLYATDFTTIDWLPGKLIERGQQAALVGAGKAGKSLLTLEWCYHAVTGGRFLGDIPRPPIRVLYLDRENSQRDLYDRLSSLGAQPRHLAGLDYRPFPRFSGSLDGSTLAVAEFMTLIDRSGPDLVVLDTISRFISGKENDSDTWLLVYSRVHAELKRRGVACLRLDHFGKDLDRGARGSSAKTQDVDHVWELSESKPFITRAQHHDNVQTRLRLIRTHTRTGIGEDLIHIARHGRRDLETGRWLPGDTYHEATAAPAQDGENTEGSVEWLTERMDRAGLPADTGRERAMRWGAAEKITAPKSRWEAVVRLRKARPSGDPPLWDSDT